MAVCEVGRKKGEEREERGGECGGLAIIHHLPPEWERRSMLGQHPLPHMFRSSASGPASEGERRRRREHRRQGARAFFSYSYPAKSARQEGERRRG